MTTPKCPKCGRVISAENINVANDMGHCRHCNVVHKLSELIQVAEMETGVALADPPHGTWRRTEDGTTVIGATHRSVGAAIGILAFALFWNSIVSIFVLMALISTLIHFGVHLPEWFPVPKMEDGGRMSVGMTIFLWIFLTPFIAIGAGFIGAFLSAIAGRTEVRIGTTEGIVFTGINVIGYRRRFDPANVNKIMIDDSQGRSSDDRKPSIIIEARDGKRVKFGTMLREDRRKFVAAALRRAVLR